MKLRALFELFDKYNVYNRSERTAAFYRDHLAKFIRMYGDEEAGDMRPHHCLVFKPTWHLILAIQRLFRWAVEEQDLLATNPMQKLRRPRLGCRRRVLSPAELLRLLRGARRDFRRFLLMARETAARPQEVRELSWEDLHWEGSSADLEGALRRGECYFLLIEFKGRTRRADNTATRIIPVSPRLGRLLWRMLGGHALTGRILSTDKGQPWNRNSLRMRLRRLLGRVDVPKLSHGERVVCYTLRHSAATSMASRGMQTSVLQDLLGHSKIGTTQRYIHLHTKQLMETWRLFHQRRRGPGNQP